MTNPQPFILAAFLIASASILTFALFIVLQRYRLAKLLASAQHIEGNDHHGST